MTSGDGVNKNIRRSAGCRMACNKSKSATWFGDSACVENRIQRSLRKHSIPVERNQNGMAVSRIDPHTMAPRHVVMFVTVLLEVPLDFTRCQRLHAKEYSIVFSFVKVAFCLRRHRSMAVRHPSNASRMFALTSSSVSPTDTQPGSPATSAQYPPSSAL